MSKCFVFGSNEAGRHGAGAALEAYKKHKARYGMGFGHYGNSFAIPTKDSNIRTLPLDTIRAYVKAFIAYAESKPDLEFKVTRVGCGLAGIGEAVMANMFEGAPSNCYFDSKWEKYMPRGTKYWGTY